MGRPGPLIFQIGFNKCATSSFFKLFTKSGYNAIHGGGRYWRNMLHPQIVGRNVQKDIRRNIENGCPPVAGFEDFQAFFDMEYSRGSQPIENFRNFREMSRAYPQAVFLLNTREKNAWLRSRSRHRNGVYLRMTMKHQRLNESEVFSMWSDDFDRHHDAVRNFFAAEKERLIEFNIDTTPIENFVDFMKPSMTLVPDYWAKHRATEVIARKRGWVENASAMKLSKQPIAYKHAHEPELAPAGPL